MGTTAGEVPPPRDASSALATMQQQQHPLPVPSRTRLTLERVLGVTSLSNAMLAVNPVTGEIAYAAGCIVVIYNLRRNKQVRYYRVEKSVACLCFSPSGQFLAIGEKGYLPAITIWDGSDGTLCAELPLHKYGVACIAFSRDSAYLVSVGLVHDQQLVAWDLSRDAETGQMKGAPVGVAVVEEKVLAMDYCHEGNFFVTVGEKHFKYWFLDADNRFLTTGYEVNNLPEIQGRSAVMAAKDDATFTSVGCGFGPSKLKTFATTADGTLCSFGVSCVMERLVSLEATHANALSVSEAYIAVGGSSSVVRLFDPATLEYKATMPFPPALGKARDLPETQSDALQPDHPHRYPAAIGVRLSGSHLVALYSDHSFFIYDIADLQDLKTDRSFLFHSGGIRDLKIAGRLNGVNARGKLVYHGNESIHARKNKSDALIPHGTFVTCGDDNTIRFWHVDLHKPAKSSRFGGDNSLEISEDPNREPWKNPFSHEMLDILYYDDPRDFDEEDALVLGGTCSWNDLSDIHTPAKDLGPVNGIRAVAIHPNLTALVAGDKEGRVMLRSLPLAESSATEIGVYTSDIQCLAFGEVASPLGSKFLVVAGGRDRLIHVHESSKAYASVQKLDNHSGAITALHFTSDGKRLVSCGADKTVVLSDVTPDGRIARNNSVPFTGGKIFDVALTRDDELMVTSCNNRLDVLSVSSGKHVRTLHVGEQHRIDICPASYCAAMSGSLSDKTIHIVDLDSGETVADGTGHGEVITAIKFTPDCRRLVTASSDGCIFVWRLAEELQTAIKSRLRKVTENVSTPPVPPALAVEKSQQAQPAVAPVMPPPAPPIVPGKKPGHLKTPTGEPVVPSTTRKAEAKPTRDDEATGRGWKGKAKAAPGPLSNVPHEDWMRTRESAITSTISASHNLAEAEHQGGLNIDRSKTPNWARTFQVSTVSALPVQSPPEPADQPRSKWAQRAGGPLHRLEDGKTTAVGLTNLSLADIDVSQSSLKTGTSLALEREQLEKRRKHIETAKAVSEMNSRLIKLGLLKSHKDELLPPPTLTPNQNDELKVQSGGVRQDSTPQSQSASDDSVSLDLGIDGIPPEMFESIDVSLPSRQARDAKRQPVMRSSIDLRVDQSMSTFTNGFAVEMDNVEVSDRLAVDQSLSTFSGGYSVSPCASISTRLPERKGVPSLVDTSQTILTRGEVNTSLSQFTDGFKSHHDVKQSVDLSGVASSMSSFTAGYGDNNPPPTASRATVGTSIDLSSVAASLSSFTTGYVPPNEDLSVVAQSLSSFTSGFAETAKVNPLRASMSGIRVDASLSAFTTGYSNPEAPAAVGDMTDVSASLSSFTDGYASALERHRISQPDDPSPSPDLEPAKLSVNEKNASVLSCIRDLDHQLQLTTQAFKTLTSEGDSNPEIGEIQSLMAQLGLAIQRFRR